MSVIAKMQLTDERAYGPARMFDLNCVCDNALMPGCNDEAKANENHTFQTATPSGDARLHLKTDLVFRTNEEMYLIFIERPSIPKFEGAFAVVDGRCASVTDYGGTSKRVDLSNHHRPYNYTTREYEPSADERMVDNFACRMMIDNPAASIQFKPGGEAHYWIGLYRASELSMSEALKMAHHSHRKVDGGTSE
jgi:hypothetical protein